MVKRFIVTVQHDKGIANLTINADNEETAKKMIMDIECCPLCAIIKVVEKKETKRKTLINL